MVSSWYRSEYSERTDREIIEKIKSQNNRFKSYIENYLDINNNTKEAIAFKSNLNKLQESLTNAAIITQERGGVSKQITFSEIAITNPKNLSEGDYRFTHYKVQRTSQKVLTIVSNKSSPTTEYFRFEQDVYDENALDAHSDFQRLGAEQQGQCKAFYKEICPYVTESVITKDRDNNIVFIAERAKVSRGIVEVLYLLRCSLIHGDVFPDNSANEVYKYTYYVLSAVLKKLV